MFPLLALLGLGVPPPGEPLWERARLVVALEQLIETGEPRHSDHDEGEELQAALTAALSGTRDDDLRWLATRAAVPIVAQIARPLSPIGDPGSLELRADAVLTLPWPVDFIADIDARVDGAQWSPIRQIRSRNASGGRLDALLPAPALRPGFHDVELRARIRYATLPDGMPSEEVRRLPSVHYGVWDAAHPLDAGREVAQLVDRGRYASVARLESGLPDVPLAIWLMQLPYAERGVEARWRTEWCALRTHPSGEGQVLSDVCLVATAQAPLGTVAEVWVKLGHLQIDPEASHWQACDPTLEGAFLRRSGRAPVALAALPALIDDSEQSWPMPALSLRSADVTVTPTKPRPGQPAVVRASLWNTGTADLYGVAIDVLAGSAETPVLHRRFVRDVPAGGRTDITIPLTLPLPYGWILVHAMPLTDHTEWPVLDELSSEQVLAVRLVNPAAAPAGVSRRLCEAAAGTPACTLR